MWLLLLNIYKDTRRYPDFLFVVAGDLFQIPVKFIKIC